MLGTGSGRVVAPLDQYVEHAARTIRELIGDPQLIEVARSDARETFDALKLRAKSQLRDLISAIANKGLST